MHPFGKRVRAKPHRSAVENVEEGLDKLWQDAHKGRVLLFSGEVEQYLEGVVSSPFARVPKYNPDSSMRADGRWIHDQDMPNKCGNKFDHPPALQPRHRGVARLLLWWAHRHPGIRRVMAKLEAQYPARGQRLWRVAVAVSTILGPESQC